MKMNRKWLAGLAVGVLALAEVILFLETVETPSAEAAVTGERSYWYVAPGGSDAATGNHPSVPWGSINQAMAKASVGAGDHIVLLPGVYNSATEIAGGDATPLLNVTPADAAITIRGSTGNAADVVIDCSDITYAVSANLIQLGGATDNGFVLKDLTIKGFHNSANSEPVIEMFSSLVGATFQNVTFTDCGATGTTIGVSPCIQVTSSTPPCTDVSVINCRFFKTPPFTNYTLQFQGQGTNLERYIVRGCQFGEPGDMSRRSGGPGAINVVTGVDSLIVEDNVGYNCGHWSDPATAGADEPEMLGSFQNIDRALIRNNKFYRNVFGWNPGVTTNVAAPNETPVGLEAGGEHPLHNSDGFTLLPNSTDVCDSVRIYNNYFLGAGHGFQLLGSAGVASWVRLESCQFDSSFDDGGFAELSFDGAGAARSYIKNCIFNWSGNNGIDCQADDIDIDHNTVIRSHDEPLRVLDNSTTVNARSNLIYDQWGVTPISGPGQIIQIMIADGDNDGPGTTVTFSHNAAWNMGRQIQFLNMSAASNGTYDDCAAWLSVDANSKCVDPTFANPLQGTTDGAGINAFRVKATSTLFNAGHDGLTVGAIPGGWQEGQGPPLGADVVRTFPEGGKAWGSQQSILTSGELVKYFAPPFNTASFDVWTYQTTFTAIGAEKIKVAWSTPENNIETVRTTNFIEVPSDAQEPRTVQAWADTIAVWSDGVVTTDVLVNVVAYPN
jgi:hypothetical protein